MAIGTLFGKCRGRYQRTAASRLGRRPWTMNNDVPLISFTFDDFPRSALFCGGEMLEQHGVRGTYYTSLGLLGQRAPTGDIIDVEELPAVLERGHEIGCHTFSHCHSFDTAPVVFEESVVENRRTLERLIPGAAFRTMSYPISVPRPATKVRCSKYFMGCRAGGQRFNAGRIDLNQLSAYFIEQQREQPEAMFDIIDRTCAAGAWLIFATHDVSEEPTQYGCTPELFGAIVEHSVSSGARIVTVESALEAIGVSGLATV